MKKFEEKIKEFLLDRGAVKVAFTNTEGLKGGPPSADLTYALAGARSAVSFAIPLDREKIRLCLSKKSHKEFEENNIETNIKVNKVGKELALWLESQGFPSKRIVSNVPEVDCGAPRRPTRVGSRGAKGVTWRPQAHALPAPALRSTGSCRRGYRC